MKFNLLSRFKFGHSITENDEQNKIIKPLIPLRFWIGVMGGLSAAFLFANRAVLAVAVIAMSNGSFRKRGNETLDEIFDADFAETGFNWSQSQQGHVLSAYFYGYTVSQIFTGVLADKMNAVRLSAASHLLSTLLTFLIPITADSHMYLLMVGRIINGFVHGPILASYYGICRNWFPQSEQPLALSVMLLGTNMGVAIFMPFTAFICESRSFFGGWRGSFYIFGFINALFLLIWHYLVTLDPAKNRFITKYELEIIQNGRPSLGKKEKIKIQWMKMAKSPEIWAISIAKGANSFSYNVFANKLPAYLEGQLNLSLRLTGVLNTIIFLAFCMGSIVSGRLSGFFAVRKLMSTTNNRKFFQTISGVGPAVCCIIVVLINGHVPSIVVTLTMALFMSAFYAAGDIPNVVDIAPDLTGTVFGIVNTISCVTAILAPLMVGFILDGDDNLLGSLSGHEKWNLVFIISAIVYILGAVFFDIYSSSDVKSWGVAPSRDLETLKSSVESICRSSDTINSVKTASTKASSLNLPITDVSNTEKATPDNV